MRVDRVFFAASGVLACIVFSPWRRPGAVLDAMRSAPTTDAYAALNAFALQAAAVFLILGVAAWSWQTFNFGKGSTDERPAAAGWRRALAALGLVVSFCAALAVCAGLAGFFAGVQA